MNPKLVLLVLWNSKVVAHIFPDKLYLKIKFWVVTNKRLDFKNLQTFNEKTQWLKLYNRKSEYINMVDKYAVRSYIAEKIGEEYLIPVLGVWDNPDDIDFDILPQQFVLKCTHNSGLGMCICKDKQTLDVEKVKKDLRKGLKQDYFITSREWPYKYVKRRIVAEEYMADESGTELKDYKVFCFDGKVELIEVDFDRFKNHKRNLYTPNWEFIDAQIEFPNDKNKKIEKPQALEKMLEIASKLSKGMPHARVDFYSVREKIYIGEITLFHGSGMEKFTPEKLNIRLGELIKL